MCVTVYMYMCRYVRVCECVYIYIYMPNQKSSRVTSGEVYIP